MTARGFPSLVVIKYISLSEVHLGKQLVWMVQRYLQLVCFESWTHHLCLEFMTFWLGIVKRQILSYIWVYDVTQRVSHHTLKCSIFYINLFVWLGKFCLSRSNYFFLIGRANSTREKKQRKERVFGQVERTRTRNRFMGTSF